MSTPTGPELKTVAWYLRNSGFTILDRDWHHDSERSCILAIERQCLVICAVAVQPLTRSGLPPQTIPAAVNTHLRAKAAPWMTARCPRFEEVRIDLISLIHEGSCGFSISHVQAVD